MNSLLRVVVDIALAAVMDCAAGAEEKSGTGTDAKLAHLRSDIMTLVGAAKCANLVNCRIAPFGLNACGEPTEYIAYSWLSTEKAALETKIAEYNFALEDGQKRGASMSACTTAPEPVAACVNGRCVIPAGR